MMKIIEETREEDRQLKRKYDSLQEFVISNIAQDSQEESPLYSQVTRGTHRATPTHASVTSTRLTRLIRPHRIDNTPGTSTPTATISTLTPVPLPAATRPTDSPRVSTGTNKPNETSDCIQNLLADNNFQPIPGTN
ncbi:hypothetical protein Pmani_010225 [Petrolisthes manimaculis]|uniref:Uncharacterized protein n=1 Tax=Petrolisthes manimaculis TaxID=1843537 RepID=A0AAE1Q4Y3_9EUCA|nr:hypothetical protein Pmani_010225 [Petrolisthes manimaculis]